MTSAQRRLVIKSLKVVGAIGLLIGVVILGVGILQVVLGVISPGRLFQDLLDPETGALIFWPPVAVGILSMWVSAYLKAGESP